MAMPTSPEPSSKHQEPQELVPGPTPGPLQTDGLQAAKWLYGLEHKQVRRHSMQGT